MRIALIGIGKIANYQMQAITHTPGVTLVDATDLDPNKAADLPGSVNFHDNLESMIQNSKADAFLVSTPTATHFDVVMKVVEAGRIVIVEKPACTSPQQLEAIMAETRARDIPFFTAFHPAYGREVDWWIEQRQQRNFDLGHMIGFESCFADPYFIDGKLTLGAIGKAGAWVDSGISSLSAMARLIDPCKFKLIEGRMTAIPSIDCLQVQGSGLFSFACEERPGYGIIDTNWTLGKNYKKTRLWYENGVVILDHAREHAELRLEEDNLLDFNLATDKPRLVNHYCGVFADVAQKHKRGEDNKELTETLHQLLFAAL